MLDLNFIRQNRKLVEHSIREKRYQVELEPLFQLDDQRKSLLKTIDELRTRRNQLAAAGKQQKPIPKDIQEGKELKTKLSQFEANLSDINQQLESILKTIPNIILPDVPLGDESDSITIKTWGDPKSQGIDHLNYCEKRNWIDFERGAKVAGAKFYYLKNQLVLLEQALIQYGIQKVLNSGFQLMTVPDVVSSKVLEGTGFNPRTSTQSDEYFIENQDLALIATAEIPLTGYHMDEILDEADLPLLYAGLSPCFRKEAGTYGKHTRGLFRVHQFNKLEMYAFCLPEQSPKLHQKILEVEESIWQELNIPYRIINIAAGDLGAPAAKKYDIEYWSPVDQTYREITSCSNCTDFQAKSLNIRVRLKSGQIITPHTLNGTAISLARTLVALIENYATKEGLIVPEPLKPYLGGQSIL